jgi:UDP-glucose 4-epimerase
LNNVVASVNVINCCIEYETRKLIYTSSIAAYGHAIPPFTEDMPLKPADPYGVAKYTVEMDLRLASEQFGIEYSILRPHNVVGIYQNIWDRYRNVVGIWIRQVLNGNPMTIYGDGSQTRAFSDVTYILPSFEKLMIGHNGLTVNVGSDRVYAVNEIADILGDVSKTHGIISSKFYLEKRDEVVHAYCDHTRAKTVLGFEDQTDMYSLIDRIFEWAKSQPNRPQKQMAYEIKKGMYNFWKA